MLNSLEWNDTAVAAALAVGASREAGESLAGIVEEGVQRLRDGKPTLRSLRAGAKGFFAGGIISHTVLGWTGASVLGAVEAERLSRMLPELHATVEAVNRALGLKLSPEAGERLQKQVLWLSNALPSGDQTRLSVYTWGFHEPKANLGSVGRLLFGSLWLYLLLLASLGEAFVMPEDADEATLHSCAQALADSPEARERCDRLLRDLDEAYGATW